MVSIHYYVKSIGPDEFTNSSSSDLYLDSISPLTNNEDNAFQNYKIQNIVLLTSLIQISNDFFF
jgi:hypothetical protein